MRLALVLLALAILCVASLAQLADIPDGANVAFYSYMLEHYGHGQGPCPPPTYIDQAVYDRLIAHNPKWAHPNQYMLVNRLNVARRSSKSLTIGFEIGFNGNATNECGSYSGQMTFARAGKKWSVASAAVDRYDAEYVGKIPTALEIEFYKYALGKLSTPYPVLIPVITPDRVYFPLRKLYPKLMRDYKTMPSISVFVSIQEEKALSEISKSKVEVLTTAKEKDDYTIPSQETTYVQAVGNGKGELRELSKQPLSVSDEIAFYYNLMKDDPRRLFADVPPAVLKGLKQRGVSVAPMSEYKDQDSYASTGFCCVNSPTVVWVSKTLATVSVTTDFRPAGGDTTYEYGGPFEMRWLGDKISFRKLDDYWAGE